MTSYIEIQAGYDVLCYLFPEASQHICRRCCPLWHLTGHLQHLHYFLLFVTLKGVGAALVASLGPQVTQNLT